MPEPSHREELIFDAALQLSTPAERAAYLHQACGDDADLRRCVEKLLAAHEQAGTFLDQPADAAPHGVPPSGGPDAPPAGAGISSEKAGDRIGRYKLIEQIGEGGFGVVWMAEQEEPVHRRVALKVIKLGMDTREVIARFEAERQALALMDHPNIARVHDGGATDTGRPYFVMELVRGIRITDYCDQNHLPTLERLRLFIQVCQAVQHAHQKGIIHRDLKPSNILVSVHDGVPVPKVIDFGIAKATGQVLTDKTLFTRFAQILGTPAYMSPEQAELSSLDIDTRSDIYSLGVVLYELLTGRTPFDARELLAAGLDEIRRLIREVEPVKPSTRLTQELTTARGEGRGVPPSGGQAAASGALASHTQPANAGTPCNGRSPHDTKALIHALRGDLDWIVMKCLEKDRTCRYETANGLWMDIQRHLNDEPVLAGPPSARYRMKKFVRKHRAAVAVAAGFVLLLTAALGVSTGLAIWASREKEEAQAVLNFFQTKVLAAPRPEGKDRGLGYDVTLRAAIRSAEPSMAGAFRYQPLVEASIRHVLGSTYLYLGEPTNAIRQFERALDLRKLHLGKRHVETLASMNNLALACLKAHLWDKAAALSEETVKLTQAKLGPDHPDAITTMHGLAAAYHDAGRQDAALSLFEQVVKLRKAKLGPDHLDTAAAINNLAVAYFDAGRLTEALPLFEQVLKIRQGKLSRDHPDILSSMNNLGRSYLDARRLSEALAMLKEAVELRRAILGPDHQDTLTSMSNLALAYRGAGRLSEALLLCEKILEITKTKDGPDDPATLAAMNNVAKLYEVTGRRHEAIPLYEDAVRLASIRLGPDHADTLTGMDNLAEAYRTAGRRNEALPLFEKAYRLRKAKRGPNDPATLTSMRNLGQAHYEARQLAEAEALLRERLVIGRKVWTNAPLNLGSALFDLVSVLRRQTNHVQAEPLVLEANAILQESTEINPKARRAALESLWRFYSEWAAATPDPDKAQKASEWKRKLTEFDVSAGLKMG